MVDLSILQNMVFKGGNNAIFFSKKDEYKRHKKDIVYMFFEEKSEREQVKRLYIKKKCGIIKATVPEDCRI